MTNFGDLRYTAWGGGVPLIYQGQVVGGVGVSGLPEAEDMVLARMAANLLK
jgi:glc operon protein GlcG